MLRKEAIVLITLLVVSVLVGVLSGIPSSASKQNTAETASGGRPITPAGSLVSDATTRQPAVASLPVAFVRSPDRTGPDNRGRYLISVNSGFGIQFNAAGNRAQQSLSVIDLNAKPAPQVVQNVFFPAPQSVNFGLVFAAKVAADGSYPLYVSGGFENKIWIFRLTPGDRTPITPASPGPNTNVEAPFIDVSGFAAVANSPRYNSDKLPIYPTGLSISPDGNTLFVANNLGDSLGIVNDLRGTRTLERVSLPGRSGQPNSEHFTYPYGALAIAGPNAQQVTKVYVSCWNDSSVAVVDLKSNPRKVSYIPVGSHPTAMTWDATRNRVFVVNSDDDSVSLIDARVDREIERIKVGLAEGKPPGNSPEGLALDNSGATLYVANAHSNSLVVVSLPVTAAETTETERDGNEIGRSRIRGFIPAGQYPSAVAVVGSTVFVGNGKGTGTEPSSLVVNNSGRFPNGPNDRFPVGSGRGLAQGGQYSVSVVSGNISAVANPDDAMLARYTQQVMRNNGLVGLPLSRLFPGASPIKHVIYVIKENRTYDQVFGAVAQSGNGTHADGDPDLAIFGAGSAAARPDGTQQDVTPNHRALALRFGLFDRFFVNSEASPDGHNWSTAAFSSDYVDKSFRWNYSRRGRGYDFEGFNRLPNYEPITGTPSLFDSSVNAEDVANYMRQFVPYLHGSRDVAEPSTLYLWDAAAKAGLTYRNYGEFVATLSEADVKAIKENKKKVYPDLSPNVSAFATKKSLEGQYNAAYRNFDLDSPDAMTVDSYRAAKESGGSLTPLISKDHPQEKFRGVSRFAVWLEEFRQWVGERQASTTDHMPNLSVVRLPNDHTDGVTARQPTPQFFVADNDYALGLLVAAVSNSPYWKDTAIFVVEDDAQDGPDHVDAHRSVGLVISAYNRPGQLVHEFHNTVSMIRTIELLLGIAPMNQLDATAAPMNIFQTQPDLHPYQALLPNIALNNLTTPPAPRDAATAYWMRRTAEQDISHADMADPEVLNQIIWFSVKGEIPMPSASRLPAFDAMRLGLREEREEVASAARKKDRDD
ncbi:MAG TPA: bifunctional YncE family protein/alkaline phosphatase family protein [Pyrinomonadaceae bacterium]|nr:bifunctional YncE family protein/alkaline phosphatase family protein [Pyrinomonadaceae bacterium]